jgi:hypothetical protein
MEKAWPPDLGKILHTAFGRAAPMAGFWMITLLTPAPTAGRLPASD